MLPFTPFSIVLRGDLIFLNIVGLCGFICSKYFMLGLSLLLEFLELLALGEARFSPDSIFFFNFFKSLLLPIK
jgi:hypothetical protein